MNNIFALLKRNFKLYFRDKTAVFFSFLSSLIVVALYLMFIGGTYIDGLEKSGVALSSSQMNFVIYSIVFATVIVTNSISIPLCSLTIMSKDFEQQKQSGFLLTKATPTALITSYYLLAFSVTALLNIVTWVVGSILVGIFTGYFLGFLTIIYGIGMAVIISFVSSLIMTLIVSLIKSTTAVNAIGGVSPTFFGFLCGIYIPYGILGNGIKIIGSMLPYTHLTIWFKQVVLKDALSQFNIPAELQTAISSADLFSADNVGFLGLNAPLWLMLVLSAIFAFGCLALSIFLLRKRMAKGG